jgi:hypothetical protein
MNRKFIFAASALTLIFLCAAQQDSTGTQQTKAYEAYRQSAIEMNELAGHSHSLDDSRALVDMIAATFADDLPPAWTTQNIRDRIARAEYESATNPAGLIPEQRIVDAWNTYVRAIAAPEETLITVAEIHNLRDGYYVTSRIMWNRGSKSIWTMPNIYAVGPNGKVADGCRAVETLRILADITKLFENLRAARNRVQKGIVVSDQFQRPQEGSASAQVFAPASTEDHFELKAGPAPENPVQTAAVRYVREHGIVSLSERVDELLSALFPARAGR